MEKFSVDATSTPLSQFVNARGVITRQSFALKRAQDTHNINSMQEFGTSDPQSFYNNYSNTPIAADDVFKKQVGKLPDWKRPTFMSADTRPHFESKISYNASNGVREGSNAIAFSLARL